MLTVITLSLALLASGAPAVAASTPSPSVDCSAALPVSIGDIGAAAVCTAIAECGYQPDVSCDDNSSPADCVAVDTDCSTGTIGYVECNGYRTNCPANSCDCSSTCCTGETRLVWSALCCSSGPYPERAYFEEECIDGVWRLQDTVCQPDNSCGGEPLR